MDFFFLMNNNATATTFMQNFGVNMRQLSPGISAKYTFWIFLGATGDQVLSIQQNVDCKASCQLP